MTTKDRYRNILAWFEENVPEPRTELHYDSAFHLLLAVILSAQCTDKRVNMVTPSLFERFPDAASLAAAGEQEVFEYIKSISFPNNKARHIIRAARMISEEFGGQVPSSLDDLVKLPGVGRKTANVMLSVVWNKAAMAVDTHVFRVSNRTGLTRDSKTPLATEKTLTANIPDRMIARAHHWLILHGRYVCTARKPNCLECGIRQWCLSYNKQASPTKIPASRQDK